MILAAETLAPGHAAGDVTALAEPLSFWGGFDAATGTIVERHHPDAGRRLTGSILVMERGRGSSSGSSTLAESIRAGTAPAGIVLGARDGILTVGALVAAQLYGRLCPIVIADAVAMARVRLARRLSIEADTDGARLIVEE